MAENVPNDDVLRRVLASQRLLLEQTQKILAQQEASKKEQKSTAEKIPLILRRTVRAAAKGLEKGWDYSSRSLVNNDVNKTLLNNVRALDGMEKIPTNSIEKAMKAHFLTLRRRKKQEDSGKRAAVLKTERRRNRVAEKLRRRIEMLNNSLQWSQANKDDFRRGMQLNCMSPEVSEEETTSRESDDDSSSNEESGSSGKKILKVCPLSWRSERFISLLKSLDRKYQRRISDRARSMTTDRRIGDVIVQQAPADIPGWMIKEN